MSRRLRWPTLPARFVADVLAGHSAVALALGALIYLVCLTGTLCVFINELQIWEAPSPAAAAFHTADSQRLIEAAIAEAGSPSKAPLVFLRAPAGPGGRTVVGIGHRQWAPASDGRLAALNLPWSGFLERLHYTLTLPQVLGEFVVGLLGVALLSLLVSGVLAHRRILRDAFVLRLGGGRLQEADLHNRMGVWGLPFHLAVTSTGALFGLAGVMFMAVGGAGFHGDASRAARIYAGPRVSVDLRPAPLPPLGRIIAESLAQAPGSDLYYLGVSAPGAKGAEVSVEVTAPGRLPRGDVFYFDQQGRQIGRTRFASGDLGLQLYSGAADVHFGSFGGLPVRLAYGLLGWALTWICAGGTSIWLARRRDRGLPAPRLERAWSAWVWGTPAALAVATLGPPLPTFWLFLFAVLAASQVSPAPVRSRYEFDSGLRMLFGAVLLFTAAVHLPGGLTSAAAALIEASLFAAAASLVLMPGGFGPAWLDRACDRRP